jgi:selT/selW/selH-like putative selenoprotein
LAAEIERKTGQSPKLIEGSRGIFDVKVDGKLVYSKYQTGTFPKLQDIVK